MKLKFIITVIIILIGIVFSCKKTPEIPTGSIKIEIGETITDSISYYIAQVSTTISSTGGYEITQHGHCWSTKKEPTIESNKTSHGKLTQPYTIISDLTGLDANTVYNIRSYVSYKNGTIYGEEAIIKTLETQKPLVTTSDVTNLTTNSATCGGTNQYGGLTISQRGVCWNTTGNTTLENSIGHTTDGEGIGSFTSYITGLNEGTTYYATAYATNEKGTSYGVVKMFTTVPIIPPTVTTIEIIEIRNTSAISGGNLTSNGNGIIMARGVCWNTTGNPTLENNTGHTSDGAGLGTFQSVIEGLDDTTTYYVTAYATNEKGNAYGQIISFETITGITDPRDGQFYETVVIGSQTWFAVNLNYNTSNSWCFDDNPINCDQYGRLYFWDAATTACPDGWHLPSDEEWKILEGNTDTQYGVGDQEWNGTEYRGWDAGKKLKTITGWNQNTGTNAVGFSALPGGYRYFYLDFYDLGDNGYWWSATEHNSTDMWYRRLYYSGGRVYRNYFNKSYAFSVRCLKD